MGQFMINLTSKYLLMIEPQSDATAPVEDRLSEKADEALASTFKGVSFRGFHHCICGERSGSSDLILPNGVITNSLMAHYVRYHRDEVPDTEINKLRELLCQRRDIILQLSRRMVLRMVEALDGKEVDQCAIDSISEEIKRQAMQQTE